MSHALPEISLEEPLRDVLEASILSIFHQECLDDAISRERLADDAGHLAKLLLVRPAQRAEFPAEPDGRIEHQWDQDERRERQSPVGDKDGDREEYENCGLLEKFGQSFRTGG